MIQHRSRHFVVGGILGTPIVSVTRTKAPFETVEQMRESLDELNGVLDQLGREQHRLLMDTRDAPPRNDEDFEQAFAPYRAAMLRGFERLAVVVRTPAGRLQVQRHVREDGIDAEVFVDELEAIAHLKD